jgi:hypothetical protein
MALDTNFNVNPYYDDFDENKKFLRILHKPGFAVQSRELTQAQTLLQNQIDRFGRHVFKNGSVVEGGQYQIQGALYLKLESEYLGVPVVASEFVGKTIFSSDGVKRAEVIKVYEADEGTGDPITLIVKQLIGLPLADGETIKTEEESPIFATIQTNGVGINQVFSVNSGVFFYDGFFIQSDLQTIAVSKYDRLANAKIGFEVTESIVTSTSDTSLLDPAQDASNYQAPGADRYKVELVLSTRDIDSTDLEKFIQLVEVREGRIAEGVDGPVYAVLEDEFARRTYDESGNYTVRPFQITLDTNADDSTKMDITLSPGKAYVFGYEFENKSPRTLTIDKPRVKANVVNKFVSADYGSFIFTKDQLGSYPIDSLATIDLHCVPTANINVSSTAAISNTKIGTARVKSVEFDSATNTTDSSTYTYRVFLFDVDVSESISSNVISATANTVTIANTTLGEYYSTVSDAYAGARLRIVTGPGSNESPKRIIAFDGTTQTVELAENFITTPTTSSVYSIDFEFSEVESVALYSGTTRVLTANVDNRSRDFASPYIDTFLTETNLEPLIFELGEEYVSNNIQSLAFSYKKLFTTTFGTTDSGVLNLDSGEALAPSTSTTEKLQDYQVIVTDNKGSAPYANGSTVPAQSLLSIDTTLRKVSVQNANNMSAVVIGKVVVSSSSAKAKSLITANSTVQTSGGQNIFGNASVIVYSTQGQTTIAQNMVVKSPNVPQLLYVADVTRLVQVLDFNGGTVANTGGIDITNRYTLDNGQRDSYYDHASIKLKSGFASPVGPIVVRYDSYSSADEGGYFSVDSYPNYDEIPTYVSPVTGRTFELRDSLDFRPVRKNATLALGNSVEFRVGTLSDNPKIVQAGSDIIATFQYYLPRIDKVVLNKNRTFEIIEGVSARTPQVPKDKDNAMTLYILTNPAYLDDTRNVRIEYINNRRYTMRDIGNIENRVQNLEYYTSLSLLEQDTLSKQDLTILDSTNLPRFKNGIITDSFTGHSVADVSRSEYSASIDVVRNEMRPSFDVNAFILDFDGDGSVNHNQFGSLVTASSSSLNFVDQPIASKSVNINPFQVTTFLGKIELFPPSDIWVDTSRRPDVLVNIGGSKDAWDLLLAGSGVSNWSYEWGSWQTHWTGQAIATSSQFWAGDSLIERTVTTQQQGQARTGLGTRVVAENILTSIGDRVVDVSIVPFMRQRNVRFLATDFKPVYKLFAYFDGVSVQNYIAKANEFVLETNDLNFRTDIRETVNIRDNTTNTSNGSAWAVLVSNNRVFTVSTVPQTSFNIASANLVGTISGSSYRISSYSHYSGEPTSATNTTITLRVDASGSNNETSYQGSNIYITSGPGMGQKRRITNYDANTRVATIDTAWTTNPTTQSVYSIGDIDTDLYGRAAGIFTIPEGTFRVGEKLFRLMDSSTGDLASSSTSGDASFFASGLLQTQEEVIVSTLQPSVQRTVVQEDRVITNTLSIRDRVLFTLPPPDPPVDVWGGGGDGGDGGADPLAQTFFVSPSQYPDGIFLDKIRICFKTKDATMPVTCQLRPSVNGYPSSSIVYPYGSISLTPDRVKTTESPSLDDASKYTDFVFPAPVYLQPGEHSFVLLTNSLKYEVYVAEMGKLDLVNNRQISEQPYLGSLFKSQNASTWTAEQNEDLMFRLFRKRFDTGQVVAQFKVEPPTSNTLYDLVHLISSEITVANTRLNYSFISERESGGLTSQKSIIPLDNYTMDDGEGRRILNSVTGNNTFVLRATMATRNPDVSPVLDVSRFGFIAVKNRINNLPLRKEDIVLTSLGSGYTGNTGVTISDPDGPGTKANAFAVVTDGSVVDVIVDVEGSGYIKSPVITIDAPPVPSGNSTATAIYNGEDKKSGGNSDVRYITRRVTLVDGFESGDLRVYLTAYKPSNCNILVYYKLLSKSDPETFDDKNYQLMTQIGNENFVSLNPGDYRELTFAPGSNGVSSDSVSYTTDSGSTYTSFKTFAIKIVMTGTDSTNVPKVRDLRAIALPAG